MIVGFLLEKWAVIAGRYTSDVSLANRLLAELGKLYSSRSRHYHNWKHIENLIAIADEYQNHFQDSDLIYFSIFYHDAVYDVFRKDNEKKSAELAGKRLALLSVPQEKIDTIKYFIEATQTHQFPQDYPFASDLGLFLDFDMSILGAPAEEYLLYIQQLRKEYRLIPGPLYRAGRKKFLESCLQAEFIFHSPILREKFEAVARQNMAQELQMYQ